MVDLNRIVQGLSQSGAVSGFAGGLAGTAVAGAFTGKKGKKIAKSALKVGAVAAVGGLAYAAYQRYQKGTPAAGVGQGPAQAARTAPATALPATAGNARRWGEIDESRFVQVLTDDRAPGGGALLLIRAMIAAAAADGHMDGHEQERIFAQSEQLRLTPAEKALLFDELRHPMTMQQIVSRVTSPEMAVEVYTASLIAIDESTEDGRLYLRSLANALELPDELVVSLYEQTELAKADEVAA
ncbi:MAG: tellurite resistance TerB family protein [Woeseiaceae bacterium]|nr:tellurite resistance TerB family protein [Woeseiaceae bacterium]